MTEWLRRKKTKPVSTTAKAGRRKAPAKEGKHNTSHQERALGRFLHGLGFKPSEVHNSRFMNQAPERVPMRDGAPLSDEQKVYVVKTYGTRSVGFVKVLEMKGV